MARERTVDRVNRRMSKGPVQHIVEAGIRAYEDVRGLNVGGAESGRRAKAKAVAKYLKSNTPNLSRSDLGQISAIKYGIEHPEAESVLDVERVMAGARERKRKR